MYFPQSLSEARASFLVNLAGVYSLRSEFDKARKCLQQVNTHFFPSILQILTQGAHTKRLDDSLRASSRARGLGFFGGEGVGEGKAESLLAG